MRQGRADSIKHERLHRGDPQVRRRSWGRAEGSDEAEAGVVRAGSRQEQIAVNPGDLSLVFDGAASLRPSSVAAARGLQKISNLGVADLKVK
jgi:hypothetical protein